MSGSGDPPVGDLSEFKDCTSIQTSDQSIQQVTPKQ